MIAFQKDKDLKNYNTFRVPVRSKYFYEVTQVADVSNLISSDLFKSEARLFLGGGSNVLFTKDFDGLVIHNAIKGISIESETEDDVIIKCNSGELWHDLVMYCVSRNWGGVENMSLIPGTVGAAPIQNIGAYGSEVREVILSVEGVEFVEGKKMTFTNPECKFGYRESIFKSRWQKNFFISSVTLRLKKKNHQLNTSYGAIQEILKSNNISTPTIKNVSDAVIAIRSSKLPDFNALGNAGSFFKNPEITKEHFQKIENDFPGAPHYLANQRVKVPAGWLIEQCGWKGKVFGHAGVHAKQALVLVNYGDATGDEIFSLAKKISESVQQKFSITLTPEVNIF